jgi:hypothetical protein
MDAREQFFFDNAGHSTPPGREECARRLAQAEEKAEAKIAAGDWRYRWIADEGADDSWMDEEERAEDHCAEACLLEYRCRECGAWRPLESLWGIFDADPEYRRVVQAELAQEALS